ncbi:MAG: hypothetical protein K8H87_06465 [Pseudorhodoplanes sp.]|nr:hypothetical protein [Pseudorhodoplanes sp.]
MADVPTDPKPESASAAAAQSPPGGGAVFPFLVIVPSLILVTTMRFVGWRGGAEGDWASSLRGFAFGSGLVPASLAIAARRPSHLCLRLS